MKKRLPATLLTLALCLSLLPIGAVAAVPFPAKLEAPLQVKAVEQDFGGMEAVMISFAIPASVQLLVQECYSATEPNGETFIIQVDWSINSDSDWKCSGVDTWKGKNDTFMSEYGSNLSENDIISSTVNIEMFRASYDYPKNGGYEEIAYGADDAGNGLLNLTENSLSLRVRFKLRNNDTTIFSNWSPVFKLGKTVNKAFVRPWTNASGWAVSDLEQAVAIGLIPQCLLNTDLTKPITRAEFAAVSVKVYEALSGTKASPSAANPFKDTTDAEVLKAFNIGITSGTSADAFSPNAILNREQAATMLTRVYKCVSISGWTLSTDGAYALDYTMPAAFRDEALLSPWAYDSVYFMAANGLITGATDGTFRPRNLTAAQTASGYANATRDQALVIAMRMVRNLGK